MTVKEIVEKYLREIGADGLYHSDARCACQLGDLFPCDECFDECKPGRKIILNTADDLEKYKSIVAEWGLTNGDWIIVPMESEVSKNE